MLYPNNDKSLRQCENLLGKAIKGGVIGTTGLSIEEAVISQTDGLDFPVTKSKVSFQKYEHGLLLRFIYGTKSAISPLVFDELNKLLISGGDEEITPRFPSPMWCLLKLGVSSRYARYLALNNGLYRFFGVDQEYSVSPMNLVLSSTNGHLLLSGSGYAHLSIVSFFQSLQIPTLEVIQ